MADNGRSPLFFSLAESEAMANQLADALRGEVGALTQHEFPDGETYLRVDSDPAGRDVVIVASLRGPNALALPLVFLADTVRDLGAARVGLVAPYLAYMRQDTRFRAGEAVTSRSFASLLSRHVDWLVAVDPHLHRFASLSELYSIPTTAVHAAAELGRWIAESVASPFLIGPDEESRQWVEEIAAVAGAPFTVLSKVRRGDTNVVESIPNLEGNRARTPVLVDDMISTGQTMVAAIEHLLQQGSAAPVCVAVHAIFAGGAEENLRAAGAARVVTTNTIMHPTNCIDVAPVLANALRRQLESA